MKEAIKLALEALELAHPRFGIATEKHKQAITSIKAALAQDEPWCMKMNGCETKCEDCPVEVVEPQPEERNFCSRCGKRTADLTAIHTCTPPQENT